MPAAAASGGTGWSGGAAAAIASSRLYLAHVATRYGGRAGLAALIGILALGLGLRLVYAAEGRDYRPPDARVYEQIAENLYRDGEFSARGPQTPRLYQPSSTYSPGLPLFAAGVYGLSGGVHLELARIALALLGAATVWLGYLIGRRLSGPVAGLVAATAIAVYPALLEYHGLLLTEPLGAFLLAAAVLCLLRARDEPGLAWWIGAGALLGALALVRAEYLLVAILAPALALAWSWRQTGFRAAFAGPLATVLAAALVLAPWTIRNLVVLDDLVPVSTGGGKVLFIGTYLDADGDGSELRALLLERRPALRARLARAGPPSDPDRYVLERLLADLAQQAHPELDNDAALRRLGWRNLRDAIADRPLDLSAMLATKAYATWTDPARGVMGPTPWRVFQLGLLVLALLGLATLALARRFEALLLGLILLYVTAVAALLIASPRRALIPLPLICALAGVGLAFAFAFARERLPSRPR